MMVEIVQVTESPSGEARVEVRSALGRFFARWEGPPPRAGDRRAVELGVAHRFTWGVDAAPVGARPHAIGPAPEGGVALWATVEDLDEDGFVALRLGPSVVTLEAHGAGPPLGATVLVQAPELTLFDTDI